LEYLSANAVGSQSPWRLLQSYLAAILRSGECWTGLEEEAVLKLRLELFVTDVQASIEFYRRVLNFQVIGQASADYTMLTNGEAAISFNKREALGHDHPLRATDGERLGLGVEIVLNVADIEGFYETTRTRGHPVSELVLQPWGLRDFRIIDPDGYYIRVTSRHRA